MSSVPVSNTPSARNTQQISQQKLAPKAAAGSLPQTRPQPPSAPCRSSSSSAGSAGIHRPATTATTAMILTIPAVAPATKSPFPDGRPIPSILNPSPSFPASTEEYQAKMREWHNQIGKKYRNKLNDKFESLQEVLVYVASHPDLNFQVAGTTTGSTSGGSIRGASVDEDGDVAIMDASFAPGSVSEAEKMKVLRKLQEEDEEFEDHEYDEDEDGEDEDDDVDPGRAAVRGSAPRRPRRRRTKGINKARMLAMARKTIVRLVAERDQLLRELAEAGEETE
ncbi:hypothetical protein V8F20_009229 [Naviculisporaceae sp. PSN 640]